MAHVMRGSHMASSSTFSQVLLSRMINPIRAVQGRHWSGGPNAAQSSSHLLGHLA